MKKQIHSQQENSPENESHQNLNEQNKNENQLNINKHLKNSEDNKIELSSTYKKQDFDKFERRISKLGKSKQYLLFLKQLDRRQYNLDNLIPTYTETILSQTPMKYSKIKVGQSTFKSALNMIDNQIDQKDQKIPATENVFKNRIRLETEYVPYEKSTNFSQTQTISHTIKNQNREQSPKIYKKDKYIEYYENSYLPRKQKFDEMSLNNKYASQISKFSQKKDILMSQASSNRNQKQNNNFNNYGYLKDTTDQIIEFPNLEINQSYNELKEKGFDSFKQNLQKYQQQNQKDQKDYFNQTQQSFQVGNESLENKNVQEIKQINQSHQDYIVEQFDEIKILTIQNSENQLQKYQPYFQLIKQCLFNNDFYKKNYCLIIEENNPYFTIIIDNQNSQKEYLQFIIIPIKEFSKQELQAIQESQAQQNIQVFQNNLVKYLKNGHQEFYIIQNYYNEQNEAQKFLSKRNLKRTLQILIRFKKSKRRKFKRKILG